MKESYTGIILLITSVILIFAGIWYYYLSKIVAQTRQESSTVTTDTLRTHAINDLATKLSFLTSKDQTGVVFPQEWQQIGTAASDCELDTVHCTVSSPNCFNPQLELDQKLALPFDVTNGTSERTGYAIKQDGNMLQIVACFSDSSSPISQKIRLKN